MNSYLTFPNYSWNPEWFEENWPTVFLLMQGRTGYWSYEITTVDHTDMIYIPHHETGDPGQIVFNYGPWT